VLLFGSFSFSGLLVNAAAIPLFVFVLVPGALLAALAYLLPGAAAGTVGDLLVDCAGAVAAWMLPWLGRVAQWDASTWLGQMPLPQLLLAGFAALACLLPLRLSVRLPALALVITGFIGAQTPPAPGVAQLAVLGAGSETSVIVTTASHRLVFGAGELNGGDGRRFRTRVIEYLQRQGGPDVELLVIGRPRAERLAAVTAAAARWPSLSIIGEPANQPLPPEIERCEQREWEWDDVSFTLMTPDTGKGCALAIRASAGSALLTLDVDEPGWRALLRRDDIDANFVMLPPSATRFFQSQSDEGDEGGDGDDASHTWLLTQRQDTDASRRRWEQLRDQASHGGQHLLDASTLPAQRVTLGTDAAHPVQLRPLQRWRWGAWSGRLPAANCSPG
jgi:competence protein ComEC